MLIRLIAILACACCLQAQDTGEPSAKKIPEAGRRATLRLAWWNVPEPSPELALLQEKDQVPFTPDVMGLAVKTSYVGPNTAVIARKTLGTEKDKQGRPTVIWAPFASVPIPSEGADLAVIMFPDKAGLAAQTQVFDFSEQAFPYGSVFIVNYTNARIDAAIGDRVVQVSPRDKARFPGQFTKRQPIRFTVAVTELGSEPKLITSTTTIPFPSSRVIYFVLERPGANPDERYHNTVVMESRPVTPAPALQRPAERQPAAEKARPKAKSEDGAAR